MMIMQIFLTPLVWEHGLLVERRCVFLSTFWISGWLVRCLSIWWSIPDASSTISCVACCCLSSVIYICNLNITFNVLYSIFSLVYWNPTHSPTLISDAGGPYDFGNILHNFSSNMKRWSWKQPDALNNPGFTLLKPYTSINVTPKYYCAKSYGEI